MLSWALSHPRVRSIVIGTALALPVSSLSADKDKLAEKASGQFEDALGTLGELVGVLEKTVGGLAHRPGKVEMEFGATLSGDCDLWIVSGKGEAEFKVTLSWDSRQAGARAVDICFLDHGGSRGTRPRWTAPSMARPFGRRSACPSPALALDEGARLSTYAKGVIKITADGASAPSRK